MNKRKKCEAVNKVAPSSKAKEKFMQRFEKVVAKTQGGTDGKSTEKNPLLTEIEDALSRWEVKILDQEKQNKQVTNEKSSYRFAHVFCFDKNKKFKEELLKLIHPDSIPAFEDFLSGTLPKKEKPIEIICQKRRFVLFLLVARHKGILSFTNCYPLHPMLDLIGGCFKVHDYCQIKGDERIIDRGCASETKVFFDKVLEDTKEQKEKERSSKTKLQTRFEKQYHFLDRIIFPNNKS